MKGLTKKQSEGQPRKEKSKRNYRDKGSQDENGDIEMRYSRGTDKIEEISEVDNSRWTTG